MSAERLNFPELVMYCFSQPELVANFERLAGVKLTIPDTRSGIERMIDQAAGYEPACLDEDAVLKFIAFVDECIWSRLPRRPRQD